MKSDRTLFSIKKVEKGGRSKFFNSCVSERYSNSLGGTVLAIFKENDRGLSMLELLPT